MDCLLRFVLDQLLFLSAGHTVPPILPYYPKKRGAYLCSLGDPNGPKTTYLSHQWKGFYLNENGKAFI